MRFLFITLFFLSGCSIFFGGNEGPKSAKGKLYSIQFSSPGWVYKKDDRSDYVFENQHNGHILLSNSFCEEFQDQSLERLAKKTFRAVSQFKVVKGEYTTFHNREAYRLEGSGLVDGVKVALRMLNTRRDNCYFDFVSISPKESAKEKDPEFEQFLKTVVFK